VSPVSRGSNKPAIDDYVLVPAILSIFLQAIQDDDSYLFLNAVQGLAAMADAFGKDVLRSLVHEYAGGLDGLGSTNLTQREVDTRVRLGEALGIVIKRCGDALGIYGECSPFFAEFSGPDLMPSGYADASVVESFEISSCSYHPTHVVRLASSRMRQDKSPSHASLSERPRRCNC